MFEGGLMEAWLALGILAALCYGASSVVAKVATSPDHYGMSTATASLLMLVGIALVFAAYLALKGGLNIPPNPVVLGVGVLVGVLWAMGMVLSFLALSGNADIARLAPIYNMNTLVAVALGIILLGELPSQPQMIRVVIGAILIVVGGILVSI